VGLGGVVRNHTPPWSLAAALDLQNFACWRRLVLEIAPSDPCTACSAAGANGRQVNVDLVLHQGRLNACNEAIGAKFRHLCGDLAWLGSRASDAARLNAKAHELVSSVRATHPLRSDLEIAIQPRSSKRGGSEPHPRDCSGYLTAPQGDWISAGKHSGGRPSAYGSSASERAGVPNKQNRRGVATPGTNSYWCAARSTFGSPLGPRDGRKGSGVRPNCRPMKSSWSRGRAGVVPNHALSLSDELEHSKRGPYADEQIASRTGGCYPADQPSSA
jgi:hypothetical protein